MTDTRTPEQVAFQRASHRQINKIGLVKRMTEPEREQFVTDYLAGRIFTSADLAPHELPRLSSVFALLLLGVLNSWEADDTKKIGVLWEYLEKAMPLGINGLPIFMSMHVMHREDWDRCAMTIDQERDSDQRIE